MTTALVGREWSASRPCRFTPRERASGTHWIRGWVDHKTGLDDMEKRKKFIAPGLELRSFSLTARSHFLCRLLYRITELRFTNIKNSFLRYKFINLGQIIS
jgi:hypothetical protein